MLIWNQSQKQMQVNQKITDQIHQKLKIKIKAFTNKVQEQNQREGKHSHKLILLYHTTEKGLKEIIFDSESIANW